MDETMIATYCLWDELLQAMPHRTAPQGKMRDAEVLPPAVTAALCFRGTLARARVLLPQHGDIPQRLRKSQLSRRLPRLTELFRSLLHLVGAVWKPRHAAAISVIDRRPMAVCDHLRIPRATLYAEARFRGYLPSKKRYCSGLQVHLLVTQAGQPGEFFLPQGRCGEVAA